MSQRPTKSKLLICLMQLKELTTMDNNKYTYFSNEYVDVIYHEGRAYVYTPTPKPNTTISSGTCDEEVPF